MAKGDRRTIVFSHANGFPAGTYRVLFDAWRAASWRVLALPKFGHDPGHPVSANWPQLRDELLDYIGCEATGSTPALVGHSMGGYLSLLAACRRPGLARAVVLIDAPLVAGWRAHALHMLKLSGLIARGGPGVVSAKRREHWPSLDAVREHFEGKRAFAAWDKRVLADYLRWGFEPADSGGVQLAFRREVETKIYNTLPHRIAEIVRRHPPGCPVSYIGGTRSPEGRQAGLAATRALVGGRLQWIEGSHLFPMERPGETARAVLRALGNEAPSD
jgi:pimeloyl-ACP methyl ester carboxylesterase